MIKTKDPALAPGVINHRGGWRLGWTPVMGDMYAVAGLPTLSPDYRAGLPSRNPQLGFE
jgi:hypothetical protein